MAVTHAKTLRRADPTTIQDKFLVGYQGWFTCAGDGRPVGPGHHGWLHWFNYPIPDGGRPNTDLWPDTSEYSPSELFPAPGLKYANGEQAFLFSSRHRKTVNRHFNWMAMHGVDGAFLQRFVGQCDLDGGNEGIRNIRDEVGDRVREAAEQEGRVFAIMYDVAGVDPNRVQQVIEQDWLHLVHEKGVLDSPNYLREKGKAVVAIWGFGFADTHHNPATIRALISFIRNSTPGGAYIMAGTPAHWRTSRHDADPNPEFVQLWLEEFDAISPWTVGRYTTLEDIDRFSEENTKGDLQLIRKRNEDFELGRGGKRKVDYIPVVLPGASGFNLSEGNWSWNGQPRLGGNFLWRQLFNVRRQNVRTIYGAMWDEYDEGTAFMPVVPHKRQLPVHDKYNFMALDEDGHDLPPDWYMRICGFAVEGLRGERLIHETFPSKELQDYWSSRPKYEEGPDDVGYPSGSGSGSSKEKGESWEEWEKAEKLKEAHDEPPPPPYTLEADEEPESEPPTNLSTNTQPTIVEPQRSVSTSYAPPVTAPRPPSAPTSTRPSPPATTRPIPSASSKPASPSGTSFPPQSHYAPPPIVVSSRPTLPNVHTASPDPIQQSFGDYSASVSTLADDFSRTSLTSSPSPRLEPPPLHPEAKKRTGSPRPQSYISAPDSHSPPFPGTPAFPNFPLPGGFAPQLASGYNSNPSHGHSGSHSGSDSWSQSTWPPPEWGAGPSAPPSHPHGHSPSPPLHSRPPYPPNPHSQPSMPPNSGYQPGYVPSYGSPAPAGPTAYPSNSPYPSHAPAPPIPSSSPYGGGPNASGYGFPQGPSHSTPYGTPGQSSAPYPPYGSSAPAFPGGNSGGYPPYGSGPPGAGPYGSNPYPSHGPPPPPNPNYGAYPSSGKPPGSNSNSNYLNSALNAIGNATGQNAKIQSLAQSGGKLWGKIRK